MLKIEKFFKTETGNKLFSILLGLGVAGLFKMSCDSRSCLVLKGPEFKEDDKRVKYNGKCYDVKEEMLDCKANTREKLYV
jgi:hypothetical protein